MRTRFTSGASAFSSGGYVGHFSPAVQTLVIALPLGLVAATAVALTSATNPVIPLLVALAIGGLMLAIARPFAVLWLAIALLPLQALSAPVGSFGGINPGEGLYLLTGVGWVLRRLISGKSIFTHSSLLPPVLIFIVTIPIGFVFAVDAVSVMKVLVMWTAFLFIFQMIVTEGDSRTVRDVLLAVAVAGAAFGVIAIANDGGQQLTQSGQAAIGRATASFGSPNRLGEVLALAIPCQVALLLRGPVSIRPALLGGLVAAAVGLSLTLSRAAFLGLAAALLLMLLWRPFRSGAFLAVLGVAALLFVGLDPVGTLFREDVVIERISTLDQGGSNPRRIIFEKTPDMIRDYPLFGVGANQFREYAGQYGVTGGRGVYSVYHAHNILLQIAAERGLLGLGPFIWLAVTLLLLLVKACRRCRGAEQAYAYALAAAFFALAVTGMFDYPLEENGIAGIVFILMGSAVVLARRAPTTPQAGGAATPATAEA